VRSPSASQWGCRSREVRRCSHLLIFAFDHCGVQAFARGDSLPSVQRPGWRIVFQGGFILSLTVDRLPTRKSCNILR
jgi:hypothetical protein